MPVWGKLLGVLFGFMFLKLPGAIIGFAIGYMFDKAYSQNFANMGGFGRFFTDADELKQNAVFFHALFSTLGHVAKSDGKVTQSEIDVATRLMDEMGLDNASRKEAQKAFNDGKAATFPLSESLLELYESCHGRKDLLQIFLEILIQAALADGELSGPEYQVLQKAAKTLKFSKRELEFLITAHQAQQRFYRQQNQSRQTQSSTESISDAYKILGVEQSDDEKTVKRAYKKRMAEHHPDKLAAKGLPPQAMEIAKQKTQSIQSAYELIKQQKNW